MDRKLERVLQKVQKPGRYVGGELGQVRKKREDVDVRIAFCFPDTYEIGMSNLGLRILYGVLNGIEGVSCERAFSPWTDMEAQMRENGIGLYALESGDQLSNFDVVAFSLSYELSFANVLNMLDLAGLSPLASDRSPDAPLVIAGGACCFNPEPMSDFIDLFIVGDGEDVVVELVEAFKSAKRSGIGKKEFLDQAAMIEGVYAPSRYHVTYNDDGTVKSICPQGLAAFPVRKRTIHDLDGAYFPMDSIVATTELVHNRAVLELQRGCIRGCRFCAAGFINRPLRSRSCDLLVQQGIESLRSSGYNELGLLSLSSSDYERIFSLCDGLLSWCEPRRISISLPSLRADNFSVELMDRVAKVRKSGLTFAPEAGSQRLRDVINKNVTESDIINTCRTAFEGGYNSVKLYFMLGLPTETDDDVIAIAELSRAVLHTWKQHARNKSRGVRINVSTSCFIPKPHTPFQWERQISMEEYLRRVDLLRNSFKTKAISYSWHSAEQSYVEAVLARGDRRLGSVIHAAWKLGARLDSWSECFSLDTWLEAFSSSSLNPDFYALRDRGLLEILPWSVVSASVDGSYLLSEREASLNRQTTPDCREKCSGCGACDLKSH